MIVEQDQVEVLQAFSLFAFIQAAIAAQNTTVVTQYGRADQGEC